MVSSSNSSKTFSSSDSEDEVNFQENPSREIACFVSPDVNDPIELKKEFMAQHPIQISDGKGVKLPFEPSKLFYRSLPNGEKIHRNWLSYSMDLNKVFCSCCMAFGDKDHRNTTYITGVVVSAQQIYKSVDVHENSQAHQFAATAAFQSQKGQDISTLLSNNQRDKRKQEVRTRRSIVIR